MPFDLPIRIHLPLGFDRYLSRIGVCPYCRERWLQLKYAGNAWEWRQCERCAAVFVTPIKQQQPTELD